MIRVIQDSAGEFRFRVQGRNGEIVATSEGYTRSEDAERGVAALVRLVQEHVNGTPTFDQDPETP
jgi:uncharacterized protein YegP (UPF0339 family)